MAAGSKALQLALGAAALLTQGFAALWRPQPGPSSRCGGGKKAAQLLSTGAAAAAGGELQRSPLYFDGFSRVACEVDVSPASARVNFKDHACGAVSSCRLLELPMEPRLCFDFCRTQKEAKFFALQHGRDCYCTTYFHAQSTGGQGACEVPCPGNAQESCGGMVKSSLFEMHMCGDSADEAAVALSSSNAALAEAAQALNMAENTASSLRQLAVAWKPGVCSIAPEGQRACALSGTWLAAAAELGQVAAELRGTANALNGTAQSLAASRGSALANATNAGLARSMELTTGAANDQAAKVAGSTAVVNMAVARVGGPMQQSPPPNSQEQLEKAFQVLGAVDTQWHALCALEALPGGAYAAAAGADPAADCARQCLMASACVAFNHQHWFGLGTCQLLTETGLVEPRISKAVPVFELSQTFVQSLSFSSFGCYAKKSFIAGHPKGPLATHVVREITA